MIMSFVSYGSTQLSSFLRVINELLQLALLGSLVNSFLYNADRHTTVAIHRISVQLSLQTASGEL